MLEKKYKATPIPIIINEIILFSIVRKGFIFENQVSPSLDIVASNVCAVDLSESNISNFVSEGVATGVVAVFIATGVDAIVSTGVDVVVAAGVDAIVSTGVDVVVAAGVDAIVSTGVAAGVDVVVAAGVDVVVAAGVDVVVAAGVDVVVAAVAT
jgi:hypothetical protein